MQEPQSPDEVPGTGSGPGRGEPVGSGTAAGHGAGDGGDRPGAGEGPAGRLVEVEAGGQDHAGSGAAVAALPCTHSPGPGPGAPVVLLLPPAPLDRTTWDDVVPLLTARCRVLAVDLPGMGSAPVPGGEPSLEAAVDGVLALMDADGASSVVVAGLGEGGHAAAQLVARAPERVAGLALLGTTAGPATPEEAAGHRETADRVMGREGLDAVLGPVLEGLSARARDERPDLVRRLDEVVRRQRPAGAAWTYRALAARADPTAALAAFPGPVLVLRGEHDDQAPGEPGRQGVEDRPDAEVVVPGAGSLVAVEAPQRVAEALLELVDAAGAGGAGA